ncbi:MAG: FMN-binding protein [Clostridiales bacterium]|nr:FMN-binding protein [Clostridiales bacterium]
MKKRVKAAALTLCILAIACLGIFLWMTNAAQEQLASMVYEDYDMALVADGVHYGETDAGLVFVRVAVLVKDHAIEEIDIVEHRNGMGSAAESLAREIAEKNDCAVDAVSGATLSSEAIKSAVRRALSAGQAR